MEKFSSTSLVSPCFLSFVLHVIYSFQIDLRFFKIHYNNFLAQYFLIQFQCSGLPVLQRILEELQKVLPFDLFSLFLTVKTIRSSSNTFAFVTRSKIKLQFVKKKRIVETNIGLFYYLASLLHSFFTANSHYTWI